MSKEMKHYSSVSHLKREYTISEVRLMLQIFGKQGVRLLNALSSGEIELPVAMSQVLLPEEVISLQPTIERAFKKWLREQYGVSKKDSTNFVHELFRLAEQTHTAVVHTLFPEQMRVFSKLNNVTTLASNPLLILKYLSSASDPILQHETALKMFLADTIGKLRLHEIRATPHESLSTIQELLEHLVFSGKPGTTKEMAVYSVHDKDNKVVSWAFEQDRYTLIEDLQYNYHLKRIHTRLRTSPYCSAPVSMDIRIKDRVQQTIKAIKKAAKNGGYVRVEEVSDIQGLQFIIMGDEAARDQFIDSFLFMLSICRARGVFNKLHIEDDDIPDGDSVSECHSMRRIQMYINSSKIPVEVIFKTYEQHLNSEYYVGTFDNNSGFWTGNAHRLFEIKRLLPLLDLFFPPDLYNRNGDTPPLQMLLAHTYSIISALFSEHRISTEEL